MQKPIDKPMNKALRILTLYERNPPVTAGFPHKGLAIRGFGVLCGC